MTTTIETNIGRLHPQRCLRVQRYGHMSQYRRMEDVPDADLPEQPVQCALCELDLTDEPDEFAPVGLDLLERYYTESTLTEKAIHDGVRHLISRCEYRLQDADYLAEYTGISVKPVSHWRSARREAADTGQFDMLVGDGLEVCFLFDLVHVPLPADRESWADVLNAAVDGDFGMSPEWNVAKSLQWLEQYRDPSTREPVNRILSEASAPPRSREEGEPDTAVSAGESDSDHGEQPAGAEASQSGLGVWSES